jgi:hypothetical protein
MMYKMRVLISWLGIIAVILSLNLITACQQTKPVADLIIDRVTYYPDLSYYAHGQSPDKIGGEFEYTIYVKNIGNAPAIGLLYVDYAGTKEELRTNYYAHGNLLKYADPPIQPGEVFIAKHIYDKNPDTEKVKFFINPEHDKLPPLTTTPGGIGHDVNVVRIKESNYNKTIHLR